jgi:fatty-acyl-CoA synthase
MICRGGENIYPKEIEDFLFTHPMIEQAEVFGIPDDHYGEVTCAWIIPARGAALDTETVRQFCKDNIAHYKLPTHIRIVDSLPMTVTGKPQKFVMREAMIESLMSGDGDTM